MKFETRGSKARAMPTKKSRIILYALTAISKLRPVDSVESVESVEPIGQKVKVNPSAIWDHIWKLVYGRILDI